MNIALSINLRKRLWNSNPAGLVSEFLESGWPSPAPRPSAAGRGRTILPLVFSFLAAACFATAHAADPKAEVKNLSVNGGLQDGKARLIIEAELKGLRDDETKLLFDTTLQHVIRASRDKLNHSFAVKLEVLQGDAKEFPLSVSGEGEIRQVTGDGLQDWGLRQEPGGTRLLILRPKKGENPVSQLAVTINAETELKELPAAVTPLTLSPIPSALFNGFVKVETTADLNTESLNPAGLIPIEMKYLPQEMTVAPQDTAPEPLAFRFLGSRYSLPLRITLGDPDARRVVLSDCRLTSRLTNDTASFALTAKARVANPKGGSLDLLSGGVALTELESSPDWRLAHRQGRFVLHFDKAGEFPIRLKFDATVRPSNGWNTIQFRVAPSSLQSVIFQGLAADTQFQFPDAARTERKGNDFVGFLPANGAVNLAWKEARPEAEGRLFYSAETLAQITISPGLMRQVVLLDFKVMQGELNRVALLLRGQGEVTRAQGDQVLAWTVEPVPNSAERRLVVQFNQPQKDQFSLQAQMQTPLGAFPQAVEAMQVRPEDATRHAGYFRIVNEGAVRLEVIQATGLSQISPEQFPESGATASLFRTQASQWFAFRFSGADYQLRVQADNVLPEVAVSEVLSYHLAETELTVEAEIELDIREAPLRELLMSVPKGFALARLNASGLSDYFLREPAEQPDAELRLVYGSPIFGKQVIQLRLERNQPLGQTNWALPKLEVAKAKSVRGHVGISADAGFRLTPETTQALTEIPTAFFPKKLTGIQAAFRLSEPGWTATVRVERLPQSIQVDAFHLFSVGEGVAYGSSVMNYLISGAPLATFRVELSDEYYNVEFTGKDVRSWQKVEGGFQVYLHTPVSGAYSLLATYERPFKAQGETLAFTGARPLLETGSEQGHTLVISAYQFQVEAVEVSPGLLPLEPGEVPPEYRLFFDAPILAAYRYTSRPFNLRLALSPMKQGETLSQVVDRASLTTRISKEGQVITDIRYLVKNRGLPNFQLTLPEGARLWSATVNGVAAVPVVVDKANLIPLPQRGYPNAIIAVDLKVAAPSMNPKRVTVAAPIVAAPVMLAEWQMEPDAKHRLVYRRGSLTPVGGIPDESGFAGLARLLTGAWGAEAWGWLAVLLVMTWIAAGAWRWAAREGTYRYSFRHVFGALLGFVATIGAAVAVVCLVDLARRQNAVLLTDAANRVDPQTGLTVWQNQSGSTPGGITFLAPVQQAGSALSVEVANLSDEPSIFAWIWRAWPAFLALAVWFYSFATERDWFRPVGRILGWTLLAWTTLKWPNGAAAFVVLLVVYLLVQLWIPALRRLWQLPRKPKPAPVTPTTGAAATAAVVLLLFGNVGQNDGRDFRSIRNSEWSRNFTDSIEPFSLTPALSPREREDRSQRIEGLGPVDDSSSREQRFPRPAGEGQGEGERSSIPRSPNWLVAQSSSGAQQAMAGSIAPLALTPALSPREREDRSQRTEGLGPVDNSGTRQQRFPLPAGEGQGEGERSSIPKSPSWLAAQSSSVTQEANQPSNSSQRTFDRNQTASASASKSSFRSQEPPLAQSVVQQIRVEDKFAFASGKIRWQATKGQTLPLLYEPAVLTRISYPTNALKLIQSAAGPNRGYALLALDSGTFDLELQYQLQVTTKSGESGFALPTQFGLVNRLDLTVAERDVEIYSPQAVSVQRDTAAPATNAVASLVLPPLNDPWIGWKPRSRDLKREKALFYAEVFQLYAPLAGVIEAAHFVQIRPAQGELSELIFDVPPGATVTDVLDPGSTGYQPVPSGNLPDGSGAASMNQPSAGSNATLAATPVGRLPTGAGRLPAPPVLEASSKARSSLVTLWRFDPDTRKLRVSLAVPQSRPFSILIKSQVAGGPLPFQRSVGLISVNGAAGQLGLLGIATGADVQLDSVTAEAFSPLNLEDFPAMVVQALQPQIPGLTLRRAFRYSDPSGLAALKASAVEPDVRVETQQTLSLGEDRTVLAATVNVEILRAGIFRLSFVLPAGLDVEAVSGSALSHWTELRIETGRVITLHLRGKTEGQHQFTISLAGAGVRAVQGWAVPRLLFREATKQQGQLFIVPEQGMRLQVAARDGLTQLDPEKSGIRQKGVLAFRLLHGQWNLTLNLEQVDAWIQVTSLQHAIVNEAQAQVTANIQYQIENTGLKSLRVLLSTNAESVRFHGEQVSDFMPVAGAVTGRLQEWEIKLHRRVIGRHLLQVNYQIRLPENAAEIALQGVQALGVNLQRGFVTVQSGGRLQVRVGSVPEALQKSEWQSVPRALRQEIRAESANFTFRLVEPDFQLPVQLDRHEAARLLPARVNNLTLTSVISDEGVMLTQARLDMVPGDKRLLHLTVPDRAHFWFAFVNQNGVWPWREKDHILIPLEQQAQTGKAIAVEFFYSSQIGAAHARSLDLELLGPKFDLPLENIRWEVYLSQKWQLKDWTGSLQLQEEKVLDHPVAAGLETYLQNEAKLRQEKTQEAEQMLAMGNTYLERGDPQQARRAFQNAFGLSTHDDAFNEDARVQLHNLKLQQALVGLNFRQATAAGDAGALAAKLRDLQVRKGLGYTQQEAKQIIDTNTEAENTALMRLAERLIQQQDAAISSPSAIRASIPQQGRAFIFTRAVQVDTWADLKVGLQATAVRAASSGVKFMMLLFVFAALALLAWAAQRIVGGGRSES
ncbi:MAG: hypothetical protein HY735_07240 [Verrucomicrobia bacterium]|nr:hypothetical protein [Verrucomicrobiota bacterium]